MGRDDIYPVKTSKIGSLPMTCTSDCYHSF